MTERDARTPTAGAEVGVETAPTHYHTASVLAGTLERLRDLLTLPLEHGTGNAFVMRAVIEGEIEELETLRAAHEAAISWRASDQAALDDANDGLPFDPATTAASVKEE